MTTAWQPMETAPKDGSPVWLCDEHGDAGGPFPMYWAANGTSWAQRGVGIWVLDGGGLTWTDEDPEGAPTLWAPRTSELCPAPPWHRQH